MGGSFVFKRGIMGHKWLAVVAISTVFLASCATTPQLAKPYAPYHFVRSDKKGYDFKYGTFYLIAPKGLTRTEVRNALNNCEGEGKNFVVVKRQGYQVAHSFGTSDRSQIASVALRCLHDAGWTIYEYTDGVYLQVGSQAIFDYFFGTF